MADDDEPRLRYDSSCDEAGEPKFEVLGQLIDKPAPGASFKIKGPWRGGSKLFYRRQPNGKPPEPLQRLAERILDDAMVCLLIASVMCMS